MNGPTKQFTETIKALAAAYGRELDVPLIEAYWIAVHDVDAKLVTEAAYRAIRSPATFMVRPGELRRQALDLQPRNYFRSIEDRPAPTGEGSRKFREILQLYYPTHPLLTKGDEHGSPSQRRESGKYN